MSKGGKDQLKQYRKTCDAMSNFCKFPDSSKESSDQEEGAEVQKPAHGKKKNMRIRGFDFLKKEVDRKGRSQNYSQKQLPLIDDFCFF